MESLFAKIRLVHPLSNADETFIRQHTPLVNFRKGDYFSEPDTVRERIGFMLEGIMRIVYHDEVMNEVTRYFMREGQFVTDINKMYDNSLRPPEFIQAVTDCRLIVWKASDIALFEANVCDWSEIRRKLTESAFLEKLAATNYFSGDATTRYEQFVMRFPELAQRIPLGYVASFLGVTQSSLSRIRRQVADGI
ncbi:MAG: Crp/Fnr family transcriptional regulator [Candidatus Kapaibacteriota bacterium]